MRKIYWFLWICCMTAVCMACSDNDDDSEVEIPGENNSTVGGIPGGDDIWQDTVRRVRRIGNIYGVGTSFDVINFDYTAKVVKGYGWGGSGTHWKILFYLTKDTSFVDIYAGYNCGTSCLMLEEGKIMEGICNNRNYSPDDYYNDYYNNYDSCYCTYADGYLKQMVNRSFYSSRIEKEMRYDFTFNLGNLSEKRCFEHDRYERQVEERWGYSYSQNVRNDANVDFFVFLEKYLFERIDEDSVEDIWCLGLFGFFGERSKSLPTNIVYNSENEDTREWVIAYEVDEEGYPIRIKIKEKDSEEERVLGIYY